MRAPIHDLHPSNLLSYASLCCGIAAIAAVVGGANRPAAGTLLAAAALADTFDGRFARQFKRTPRQSALGAQVDNLVDASVFGVVPIVVVATLVRPEPGLWWLAACGYAVAVVTRLAFFQVEAETGGFVGVPTPAIALVWATELLAPPGVTGTGITLVVTALAMVCPIPIPRPRGLGLAAFAGWAVVVLGLHLRHAFG